jgi:hypothetical protein
LTLPLKTLLSSIEGKVAPLALRSVQDLEKRARRGPRGGTKTILAEHPRKTRDRPKCKKMDVIA